MLVQANVIFIGCKQESFKNKAGQNIQFQRVNFVPEGCTDTMCFTALKELDFSKFDQFHKLPLTIDFYNDSRSGYLKAKIVGIG